MGRHFDNGRSLHVRLFGNDEVTLVTDNMPLINRACKLTGLTMSEFVRMAAIKEAKLTIVNFSKERVAIAKKILIDENARKEKEKVDIVKEDEQNRETLKLFSDANKYKEI